MLSHILKTLSSAAVDGRTIPLSCQSDGEQGIPVSDTLTLTLCQSGASDGYLYRTMRIGNTGSRRSGQITQPRIVDAYYPCGETVTFHSLRGDDCSQDSFMPRTIEFRSGDSHAFAPVGGRSSNTDAFPFFDLSFDGYAVYFAVGWSGQWCCTLEHCGSTFHVSIGLQNADFYLEPEENCLLPSVFMTEAESGDAVRRLAKKLMFRYFDPLAGTGATLPVSIQPYDRYFYGKLPVWPTEAGQIMTLENAKKCGGIDTLWLDAAWFRRGFPYGVGNYTFETGFPRGLKPVSDAVHRAGMRFMVWFEPERIYRESEVWKEHPEFLLTLPGESNTFLFDLGREDAYLWLHDTLSAFIRENGIDNYRQDFNMDPLPYWTAHDEKDRIGITEIRHIGNLYRLWDALKSEFPQLLIDNCASGGRRIDFETVRRAVPMWRSDVACGPITDTAHNDVYDQNQTLSLGEYLPYHACAVWELSANDTRSAATAGLACTFDVLNPDFDFERAGVLLEEVGRLSALWDGDFYPLTEPTLREDCFAAYQIHKGAEGFAVFFRRADCLEDTFLFRPHGIDRHSRYSLILTDENYEKTEFSLTGEQLAEGTAVVIPKKHETAVLTYRKQ